MACYYLTNHIDRTEETLKIIAPLSLMPEGSKESDILDISISKDEEAKEEARQRVQDLIGRLKINPTSESFSLRGAMLVEIGNYSSALE